MPATAILLIALLSAVFAKGQGKPGTYTTRDGRTFAAGSAVPKNINADDLKAWRKEGYILEPTAAEVEELGGVAHDVPDEDLTPTQRARRRRSGAEEPATVPKSSLREDPTATDDDGDLEDAHASDPQGVADDAEEAGREDTSDSGAADDADEDDSDDEAPAATASARTSARAKGTGSAGSAGSTSTRGKAAKRSR